MLYVSDWRQLKLGRDDRAAVIGATGTGKTTLVRFLLEDKWKLNSVVYDNKPSDAIARWKDMHTVYYDFRSLEDADEGRLIYTPPVSETLSKQLQDRFFAWIYDRRYTRLYIDEASALKGGTDPSYHLQACLCRGRERGVGTITGTQRPARVPLILMSESEHFYVFRLNMLVDRIRIAEMTGITVDEQTDLKQHQFYYYNAILGERSNKLTLNPSRVTPQHASTRSYTNARKTTTTLSV